VGILIDVYEEPTGTRLMLLVAGVSVFAQSTAEAQAGITVNGQPAFGTIDGAAVQQSLQAAEVGQPAQQGGLATAPTSTPPTGLNPGTSGAPTPAGVAQVTPAAQAPTGGAPQGVARGEPALPGAGPVTRGASGASGNWSGGWTATMNDEQGIGLWDPGLRVEVKVWDLSFDPAQVTPSAQSFTTAPFVTDHGMTVQSAVDIVPGTRFMVVTSAPQNGATLWRLYDVTVTGAANLTITDVTGFDGTLAAAVPTIQGTVTVNGQQALAGAPLPAELPPAQAPDPTSARLTYSGRTYTWTNAWAKIELQATNAWFYQAGADDWTFRMLESSTEQAPAQSLAEQSVEGQEEPGWTILRAIDVSPDRAVIVIQRQGETGVQYRVWDFLFVNGMMTGPSMKLSGDDIAGQIATIQANVTIDGAMPFADLQTLVPELFSAAATTQGQPAVTGQQGAPAAPGAAGQGGTHTVALDGTTLTWTAGWTIDQSYVSDSSVKLVNDTDPRISLVYVQATALRGVTSAESYRQFLVSTYPNIAYLSVIDVPDSPTPRWVSVSENTAEGMVTVSDCRVTDIAPICLTGTFPRDAVSGSIARMQAEVAVNGIAPFAGMEDGLALIFG
jgi:hypothetical protein